MAIGTNEALPFAPSCRTATARGPASFFLAGLRSPGMICGRSSCAAAMTADKMTASSATKSDPRYRIFWKVVLPELFLPAFDTDLLGDIPMNVNDKAPDFTLPDENGKEVALSSLRGKTLVLYFFPRADTPG